MHSAGDGRLGCFQFGVIISHAAIPVNGPWYVCIQVSLGVYSGVKLLTDKHAYLQLLDIIKGLSKVVTVKRRLMIQTRICMNPYLCSQLPRKVLKTTASLQLSSLMKTKSSKNRL